MLYRKHYSWNAVADCYSRNIITSGNVRFNYTNHYSLGNQNAGCMPAIEISTLFYCTYLGGPALEPTPAQLGKYCTLSFTHTHNSTVSQQYLEISERTAKCRLHRTMPKEIGQKESLTNDQIQEDNPLAVLRSFSMKMNVACLFLGLFIILNWKKIKCVFSEFRPQLGCQCVDLLNLVTINQHGSMYTGTLITRIAFGPTHFGQLSNTHIPELTLLFSFFKNRQSVS